MIEESIRMLTAPTFDNEEENRQANLLNIFSMTQALIALVGILAIFLTGSGSLKSAVASGIFLILAISSQLFLRLRKIRSGSILLISGNWIVATLTIYSFGGIAHPFINFYFVILIFSILLIGGRPTLIISGLTVLTLLGMSLFDQTGTVSNIAIPALEYWGLESILLIFAAVSLSFGLENLKQALMRSYRNQASLAKRNRKLSTIQTSLEEQISERTARLQQRSSYLEASIEIGRVASSVLEIEELIHQVVNLIQASFDLYYTGLFLVEPSGEWAVLKAGTGEAGKAMQEREHRVKIGNGMVGWSIANMQPRVSLSAKEDSIRLVTPELSDTVTEAALPLRSRGKVIGALSVQSNQRHTFDEDMVVVLQTMADQIATAIDNARLFTENQAALERARQTYDEISQGAWNELFKSRSQLGFRYLGAEILPIEGEWQPEMVKAAQTGQRLEISEVDKATLTIPLRVRNQVVGALNFRKDGTGKAWTADETSLLETLTEQLGVALESARLYEETQRRAERERLTSEISAKLRASNDPQTILQTAVKELRQALQVNRAQVLLQPHEPVELSENISHNGHKLDN